MTKYFQKIILKNLFWAIFARIWTKMNFPGKKGCQFLNIPIIYQLKSQLKN